MKDQDKSNGQLIDELRELRLQVAALEQTKSEGRQTQVHFTGMINGLLSLGVDPLENITRLTAMCGDLLNGTCALYNRLEEGMLCSVGHWHVPPDYNPVDSPDGHICFDVISRGLDETMVVRDLPRTPYAETDPNVIKYDLQTYVGHPVKFGEAYIGSLCVVYTRDVVPSENDRLLIRAIASAIAMEERRKQAEEALELERQQLLSIFDSINEVISVADAETYEILYTNKFMRDRYGKELIGSLCYKEVHGLDRPCSHCVMAITKSLQGEPYRWDYHNPTSGRDYLATDRIIKWTDGRDAKFHLGIDVTERKQAEEALREREAYLRAILNNAPFLMWLKDQEGRFLAVNDVFAKSCGKGSPEAVAGKTDLDVWPLELAELYRADDREIMLEKRRKHVEEPVFDSGETKWFETYKTPIVDDQGVIMGTTGFARDITYRKRMEMALEESEKKYRSVFDNAAVGINLKSSDGTFWEVNQAVVDLLGYSREELNKLSYLDITHPDDVQISGEKHAALERGDIDTYRIEKRYLTKDGGVVWVDTSVTALRDSLSNIRATVGIIADITERKNAEQALLESEERYRRLFSVSPDGIMVHSDGKCILANHSAAKMLGAPFSADLVGMPIKRFIHSDYHQIVDDRIGRLSGGQQTAPILEEKFIRLDGRVIDVEVTASSFPLAAGPAIQAVFRDITERKRAEEVLRKQYELQRALLSSIPAYVYFKDKDSVYITGNKRFTELNRVPENEIPGKTDYDFFSETDADSFRRDDAEIVATGKAKLNCEMKGTDAKGNTIWYSMSKSPFYDSSGEVAGLVGICLDITDLKRTQELLLQSERFRAVADLAGGVAHNFNNLLQIVIGNLELALLDLEMGNYPDVKNALEKVLQSSRFGAETVRRLQSFAGIRDHSQLPEKGIFDLSGVVSQALEMSKTWWKSIPEKEGIEVSLDTELQDGCLVQGEKNELFEVVVNLIKNASEALPQGGTIHVKTGIEENQVVLNVRDTGIGISETNLKRLFNPFFTTKANSGSGLGLASSFKIIKDWGGEILVESSEGKGATFTILLPLAEQPSEHAGPPAHIAGPRMTILVIDDMEAVLDVLKAGLTRSGHVVVTAPSGEQGLDIFKENPIDLVISDLAMAGMNGWEVGKRIRSICEERHISKTPFILLTGWGGQKTEAEKIAESGVDVVVEKPINIANIVEIIRAIGEREPSQVSQ